MTADERAALVTTIAETLAAEVSDQIQASIIGQISLSEFCFKVAVKLPEAEAILRRQLQQAITDFTTRITYKI